MLKVSQEWIRRVGAKHPSFEVTVQRLEAALLPPCPVCAGEDTAVLCYSGGDFSEHVAAATTRLVLCNFYSVRPLWFRQWPTHSCNECGVLFLLHPFGVAAGRPFRGLFQ